MNTGNVNFEWLDSIFTEAGLLIALSTVWQTALAGLPFAGVVLLIVAIGGRWLTSQQRCLLWSLVLLRLMVFWTPASAFSLENFYRANDHQTEFSVEVSVAGSPDTVANQHAVSIAERPSSEAAVQAEWISSKFIERLLAICWLAGLILIPGTTILAYLLFKRQLKRTLRPAGARIELLWEDCQKQAGSRKRVPVGLSEVLRQPAVVGLFQPRLVIPADLASLSDQQLNMIMLHELAHLRRYDLIANWCLLAIRACYWWNPVYWLAASRYHATREQACDEDVLRKLSPEQRRSYGKLLLELVDRPVQTRGWRATLPVSLLNCVIRRSWKMELKTRLRLITSPVRERSRSVLWATHAVICVIVLSGFTQADQPQTASESHNPPLHFVQLKNESFSLGSTDKPRKPVVYPVADAVDRLARTEDMERAAAFEHLVNYPPFYDLMKIADDHSDDPNRFALTLHHATESFIVKATDEEHELIAHMLETYQSSGFHQIVIECTFLTAQQDLSRIADVNWETFGTTAELVGKNSSFSDSSQKIQLVAASSQALPIVTARIPKEKRAPLLNAVQARGRSAQILNAPKITLFNGQEGRVSTYQNHSLTTGWKATSAGSVVPQTAEIQEGTQISIRPTVIASDLSVQLAGSVDFKQIDEIQTIETSYAGEIRSIQSPRLKEASVPIDATLLQGDSILVGILPSKGKTDHVYVLVSCKVADSL